MIRMEEPIVTISTGKLRGKTLLNVNNKRFYSFQGIPYAKDSIGPLRFKAPLPPESWNNTRDATHEGNDCIHRNLVLKTIQGGENCLSLNVYTPNLPQGENEKEGKPVMFWIHGGGFIQGSGSTDIYGPEFLLTEDIVLVTINYRLGVFGFLSLEDPDLNVPGNAGLKDMVMALRWVQENISQFSGDANNVTVFGESAGAAATHYLILSPLAKGLFHKAIIQSGCALNLWAKGSKSAKDLANILNLETSDEKQILNALEKLPAEELFLAAEKVPDHFVVSTTRPHGPVIERKHSGAFLSEDPLDIIKSGRYNHVPIMIGYTTREGMLSEVYQNPNRFRNMTDFYKAVPHFLKDQLGYDFSKMVAKQIKEFYYGSEEPSEDNKDKFYLIETDNFFLREMLLAVKLQKQTSTAPIFLYRMSIETALNMMKNIIGITEAGVEFKSGSQEEIAIKIFIKLWTNFAKYGNPNSQERDDLINVKWEAVSKDRTNFLDIGKNLTLQANPESDRMAFWAQILNVKPVHKL